MWQVIRDQFTFFREFRHKFQTTGAIAPSSSFLAQSMTSYFADRNTETPVRILEIGPGTGPVTDRIIRSLGRNDTFDLVELNENFADRLQQRFSTDERWKPFAGISSIHRVPLQEYRCSAGYDFIISGLPLNNFPADLVRSLTERYFELLKPGGVLSYFEYMYVRPIRMKITRGPERDRISQIDEIMSTWCRRYRIRRDSILLNIPPAWVQHLQTPCK
jgi:phospholipid N-methyltransferase